MGKANNMRLMAGGYAPAQAVATAVGKALTTIHHMIDAGKLRAVKDNTYRYVDLSSLRALYPEGTPIHESVEELVQRQAAEVFKVTGAPMTLELAVRAAPPSNRTAPSAAAKRPKRAAAAPSPRAPAKPRRGAAAATAGGKPARATGKG